jgi:uracil-DNA glycosylase family 4
VLIEPSEERSRMLREVRQRLESLRRAGLDRIPEPPPLPSREPAVLEPEIAAEPPPPSEPPRRAHAVPAPVIPAASLFGEMEMADPPVPPSERPAQLAALAAEVAICRRCPALAASRTQTVFGTGSPTARLMFIGEAPGAEEDRLGEPFVGRAGVLLTDMITKGMGLQRSEVYIANILKSRPPENRDPEPVEIANCLPYLERQVAIIRPEYLCLLGRIASQTLMETALPMSRLRGKWHRYRGIPTIVTYHPAYLLRNPAAKKDAWEDLKMLMQAMGLKPPGRGA